MRRLYLRIYVAVLASLFLFVVLAGLTLKLMDWGDREDNEMATVIIGLSAELLPARSSKEQVQATLERWHQKFAADLAVFDQDGRLIASAGRRTLAAPSRKMRERAEKGNIWARGSLGPQLLLRLPGGRFLAGVDAVGSRGWRSGSKGILFIVGLLSLIGVAVAIVAWPLARRLTRRLEQLQHSVQAFGRGDLSARASVRGKDEVARLADSFNQSADHIEQLVAGQRTLLANASHELRSPLARIRMAAELMQSGRDVSADNQPASDELLRNVGELDDLVDEILLASRLDVQAGAPGIAARDWSDLDLGGLIAEEGARCGISPNVSSIVIIGDARLLRRMVRNLIENAMRYGIRSNEAADIAVSLRIEGSEIIVSVCDRGPGVPVQEREKIFEAFYRASGASERSGGVGLGLSLVRQIARLHGGRVSCEPRDGGGSCFIARLPDSLLEK